MTRIDKSGRLRSVELRICPCCNKEFYARIEKGAVGRYCSQACMARYRNAQDADKFEDGMAWKKTSCKYCGKECLVRLHSFKKKGYGFCSRRCACSFTMLTHADVMRQKRVGEGNPNWKGGTQKYHMVGSREQKELLHRVVMEQHLGRKLDKNEIIHHIDCNKKNNDLSNLIVLENIEHTKLHSGFELLINSLFKVGIVQFLPETKEYITPIGIKTRSNINALA